MFRKNIEQPTGYKVILILFCLLATGCAHRINITPPLDQLEYSGLPQIEKKVGYYISPENLEKQVVTPGGGGDSVKYLPYKESKPALRAILSNIFIEAYPISSLNDTHFITSKKISYIFIPKIETNSSSRSIWIWPPSDFTISLECKTTDSSGMEIWRTKVTSEANLGLPSVHRDHSLAGKTAMEEAFSKLQKEIHEEFYDGGTDIDNTSDYLSPQSLKKLLDTEYGKDYK